MATFQIAVLVGSLRRDSLNRRLAAAVTALAPRDFSFITPRLDDLPLYNQDDDQSPAEPVKRLKREIQASDGVIFVTPEYNRSVPGVLKNAIDHASRPYGQSAWAGKPAGVMGASIGAPGTSMAQQHLRCMLGYLDMPTLGQPEVFLHAKDDTFDDKGALANDGLRTLLQTWMDKYVVWVRQHARQSAGARG
jgi:chromate reductase